MSNKKFHVSGQTRDYTEPVIIEAEVVAENDQEAQKIFKANFQPCRIIEFIRAHELIGYPTEGPTFRRLDHNHLNEI